MRQGGSPLRPVLRVGPFIVLALRPSLGAWCEQVGPFVKRAFPNRERRPILLDGEPLLHAPDSKSALRDAGLVVLSGWPAYSPDLTPQENVWPLIKNQLRKKECTTDAFEAFKRKLKNVARQYPTGERLIPTVRRCTSG